MQVRNFKSLVVILFMSVFLIKMSVSIAPAFLNLDDKTVSSVILQLEQDSKTEKENPDKDAFKEKKSFDEYFLHTLAVQAFFTETNVLHNLEHSLLIQLYHPVVPTPPPNV